MHMHGGRAFLPALCTVCYVLKHALLVAESEVLVKISCMHAILTRIGKLHTFLYTGRQAWLFVCIPVRCPCFVEAIQSLLGVKWRVW
jgi:hypothetical protein